jgi:hypothetical protein
MARRPKVPYGNSAGLLTKQTAAGSRGNEQREWLMVNRESGTARNGNARTD